MIYLVVEIAFFLVLATALGAAVAYFVFRRRFEDVTDEYAEVEQSARQQRLELERLQAERVAGIGDLAAQVSVLQERLSPLTDSRLARIEERLYTELGPLAERVVAMENSLHALATTEELGEIRQQLETVAADIVGLPKVNLEFTERHIAEVEARLAGLVADMQSLPSLLGTLEERVEGVRASLSQAFDARISGLEGRLTEAPPRDVGNVDAGLAALHAKIEALPVLVVENRLQAVEQAIASLPIPELGGVEARLEGLQARVEAIPAPDFSILESRLGVLEERLSGLSMPELGGVEARLAAIEAKMYAWGPDTGPSSDRIDEVAQRALASDRPPPGAPVEDELAVVRREGSRNLLTRPAFGPPDDLKRIRGVGPVVEELLHDVGVYYFWQVAQWTEEDVKDVDARLEAFKGRIGRDLWVFQARAFMLHNHVGTDEPSQGASGNGETRAMAGAPAVKEPGHSGTYCNGERQ